jgi:hypothetical protein
MADKMTKAKNTKQKRPRRKPLATKVPNVARKTSLNSEGAAGTKLSRDEFHALVRANLLPKSKRLTRPNPARPKLRD